MMNICLLTLFSTFEIYKTRYIEIMDIDNYNLKNILTKLRHFLTYKIKVLKLLYLLLRHI